MKKIKSAISFLLIAMLCMTSVLAIPAMAATPNEPVVYDFTDLPNSDTSDESTIDVLTDDFYKVIILNGYLQITSNNCIDNNCGYAAYTVEAPAGEAFTAMSVRVDFARLAYYDPSGSADFTIYVKADNGEYQVAKTVTATDTPITELEADVTNLVTGASKVTVKLEIKLTNPVGHAHDWTQISKLTINNSSAAAGDGPSQTGDFFVPVLVSLFVATTGLFVLTLKRKH